MEEDKDWPGVKKMLEDKIIGQPSQWETLYVYQIGNDLSFKIANVTTGIKGFISWQKENLIPKDIIVFFNGVRLDEPRKLHLFRQIDIIKNELEN